MVSCLFVVYDRVVAPDGPAGACSGLIYSRLRALTELGHEVHLWHFAYEPGRRAFDAYNAEHPEQWDHVRSLCASVELSTYSEQASVSARLANHAANAMHSGWVANPVVRSEIRGDYGRLLDRLQPDLAWAESFGPGQMATLRRGTPLVYSHTDWRYRIRAERLSASPRRASRLRREEERIALAATAVVSGSAVECSDLERLGCHNVHYLPVGYTEGQAVDEPHENRRPAIVHLGSLSTTASRLGLTAFVAEVVPNLGASADRLTVIGDISGAADALATALVPFNCVGYVDDLSSVLHPYDVHVIPWDQPTGQRTRAIAALRHRQVVVAVGAGVACFPELVDGVNCRLVDHVADMAAVITELLDDGAQRRALGDSAAETFERAFTIDALLPRYSAVIDSLLD